jgi:hypothetical protein
MSAGGAIGQAIRWKYGKNHVTLVHTRFPLDEFIYNPGSGENDDNVDNLSAEDRTRLYRAANGQARPRISGQWGTMAMIIGPRITRASFTPAPSPTLQEGEHRLEIDFVGRRLHLSLQGENQLQSMKLFTTIERYRTDGGQLNQWGFGYVRMLSREEPYGLRNETGNPVVKKYLKRGKGDCIRILGGATGQQRAILIHDAPHVGFVIGCIGPRPWNDRRAYFNVANNPSDTAVREIMGELSKAQGKGSLYVLRN